MLLAAKPVPMAHAESHAACATCHRRAPCPPGSMQHAAAVPNALGLMPHAVPCLMPPAPCHTPLLCPMPPVPCHATCRCRAPRPRPPATGRCRAPCPRPPATCRCPVSISRGPGCYPRARAPPPFDGHFTLRCNVSQWRRAVPFRPCARCGQLHVAWRFTQTDTIVTM